MEKVNKIKKNNADVYHKRRLKALLITFSILILLLVNSVFNDWRQILHNQQLKTELTNKYNDLLEDEKRLSSEVTKLQDLDYILLYAREKYGYSKEGELVIQIYSEGE